MATDGRDYLQHHGILGMHWGVRRYQPYGEGGYNPKNKGKNIGEAARSEREAKKSIREDQIKSAKVTARQMDDNQLQAAVNRKKLEKEYIKLSSESIDDGRNFVKYIAIVGGTAAALALATKGGAKAGEAVVASLAKKNLDPEVFKAVYPKK